MDNKTPNGTGQNAATHNPYFYLPEGKAPPMDDIRRDIDTLRKAITTHEDASRAYDYVTCDGGSDGKYQIEQGEQAMVTILKLGCSLEHLTLGSLGINRPPGESDPFVIHERPFSDECQDYAGWCALCLLPLLRRITLNGGLPEVPADVGNPDNPSDLIASIDRMRKWFALGDLLRPDVRAKLSDYFAHEIVMLDAAFSAVGRTMPDIIIKWKVYPECLERTLDDDDAMRMDCDIGDDLSIAKRPTERFYALNEILLDLKARLEVLDAKQRRKPAPAIIDQPDAAPPVASIKTVKPKRASTSKWTTEKKIDLAIGEMRRNPQGTLKDYADYVRDQTEEPFSEGTLSKDPKFQSARKAALGQVVRGYVKSSGTGRNRDRTIEATDDE